jgi:hypothetical protein
MFSRNQKPAAQGGGMKGQPMTPVDFKLFWMLTLAVTAVCAIRVGRLIEKKSL